MALTESSTHNDDSFAYLILDISTNLINAAPDEAASHIEQALAALGSGGRKDRCYVFLFDETYQTMSNTHEWVAADVSAHKDDLQDVPINAMPWFFEVMLRDGKLLVDDVSQLPAETAGFKAELERENIGAMMAVGMYLEAKLIGFVGCDLVQRKTHWQNEDVRQMRLVADMITNTIARHRSEAELTRVQAELREANAMLARQAQQDSLTQLLNRRGLDAVLDSELRRTQRNQQRLTVFMIDIDHFKQLNDERGHIAGDEALCCVAQQLKQAFQRSGEQVARYGGDEFIVIAPNLTPFDASQSAAALLEAIRSCEKLHGVTVSIGIFSLVPEPELTTDEVLRKVDHAVYQAKSKGRDGFVLLSRQ
ncbi:GGDEF domain-containing protein [Pseudidiomarina salilacus]|uniref:GGDEF domain-containing protein n=1 Tax=Pseudidiomarina salilacus TaxID=3384452 RepID=UPI00398468F8